MGTDGPELTDGRLLLRLPTDADVPAITAACQDPDIARYTLVPSPYTEDDARGFVERALAGHDAGEGFPLAVTDAGAGTLLGTVGIFIDRRDLVGTLGYWVAAGARGRGVASDATGLLCRYGFDELGLMRLQLEAATENVPSNAVAAGLGFRLEGTRRSAAPAGHDGTRAGVRFDMNVWGLLPGELRYPRLSR